MVEEKPDLAHLQTLSYVYLRLGKTWDQLLSDTRALALAPGNKTALQNLIASLTVNRVNTPALALANEAELPASDRRNLEVNAAAEMVRIAEIPPGEEKARFTVARRALDRYDALLAKWAQRFAGSAGHFAGANRQAWRTLRPQLLPKSHSGI
ncbi:outer membrane protein PgaA [Cedecea neteri]|uniref:Outer membrane protein PgaA n=1 Tax=Cedecea neteri TaxID=158822 RepID=A0A2X3L086_9ENTR|nr:outer membrane protein PgaA [Cedecea neteri]